jgi:meiotically up-regulated gene 157 (Mug157) protein
MWYPEDQSQPSLSANGRLIRCAIRYGSRMDTGDRRAIPARSTNGGGRRCGWRSIRCACSSAGAVWGPYHFQRASTVSTEMLPADGFGNPIRPVGLIASGFRPSDDACVFPFLVPSNLFAVTSLRQLAEMSHTILHDDALANEASSLAGEVEQALGQYAVATTPMGTIWAYEVDGFGSQLLMDDANVPSLLGLPYLESSPNARLYARTRAFCWSACNPWFFRGSAGEGIGGPHEGVGMIWPLSQIIYALTSSVPDEIRRALEMLKRSAEDIGFMHESYYKDDSRRFTRAWFAWANTLFGELVRTLAATQPEI